MEFTYTQADVASQQSNVWISTTTTVVPATAVVILRFIARRVSHAGFWWDDYIIAVSMVFTWFFTILRWIQTIAFNSARESHAMDQSKAETLTQSFLATQVLYWTTAVLTKVSLLLLYYRIFGIIRRFCYALWVSGCLIVSFFIAGFILTICACSPVDKFWRPYIDGHCIDIISYYKWSGVTNMLLDVLVLCLPFPMTWRLQTTRRQKFILSIIFLLGSFVVAVSILRITSYKGLKRKAPWNIIDEPSIWSIIEQSVGIICACLPTLRPLARNLYDKSKKTSLRGKRESGASEAPIKPSNWPVSLGDEENIIGAEPVDAVDCAARHPPSPQEAGPVRTEDSISHVLYPVYHTGDSEKHTPRPESFA